MPLSTGAFAQADRSRGLTICRDLREVAGFFPSGHVSSLPGLAPGIAPQFAGRPAAWLVLVDQLSRSPVLRRQNETPAVGLLPRGGRCGLMAAIDSQAAACGRTPAGRAIGLLALSLNSTVMKTISGRRDFPDRAP